MYNVCINVFIYLYFFLVVLRFKSLGNYNVVLIVTKYIKYLYERPLYVTNYLIIT